MGCSNAKAQQVSHPTTKLGANVLLGSEDAAHDIKHSSRLCSSVSFTDTESTKATATMERNPLLDEMTPLLELGESAAGQAASSSSKAGLAIRADSGASAQSNTISMAPASKSELSFCGVWKEGTVSDSTLTFHSTKEVVTIYPEHTTRFTMQWNGIISTADLHEDGLLHWSNGDVWHRPSSLCVAPSSYNGFYALQPSSPTSAKRETKKGAPKSEAELKQQTLLQAALQNNRSQLLSAPAFDAAPELQVNGVTALDIKNAAEAATGRSNAGQVPSDKSGRKSKDNCGCC